MFVKEYDEFHIKNRLYIYWDITTKCNFNCSYCYAKERYIKSGEWNLTDSFKRQELILKSLSMSNYPIFLGFHGGEPTLHKNFFELTEKALKILKHPLSQLYITTNGSTNVFKKIYNENLFKQYKSKLRFLFSFHPSQIEDYQNFIKNVFLIDSMGFKTKVNILLDPSKKFWQKTLDVFDICNSIVKTHPHFIYDCSENGEKLKNYNDEFYKVFKKIKESKCYYIMEDENQTKYKISDYEMFKNNLNSFKNWKCYNNNFEIFWNGIFHKLCTTEFIDLCKNPFYLKHLKLEPMICNFDRCYSDGVLKCIKEK